MYNALVFSAYDPAKITVGNAYPIGYFSLFRTAEEASAFSIAVGARGYACETAAEAVSERRFPATFWEGPPSDTLYTVVAVKRLPLAMQAVTETTESFLSLAREHGGALLYWDVLSNLPPEDAEKTVDNR